jgi:hypothetical protein
MTRPLTSLVYPLVYPEIKGLGFSLANLASYKIGWGARDRTWECRNQKFDRRHARALFYGFYGCGSVGMVPKRFIC